MVENLCQQHIREGVNIERILIQRAKKREPSKKGPVLKKYSKEAKVFKCLKMFVIPRNYGSVNQNNFKFSSYACQNTKDQHSI